MITPDNLRSNISFEFRAIKRKLLSATRDQKSNALHNNLIMVTSALPGEGKTFTASNLAFALTTERDLQVLLIDADVIRPSIGSLFDHRGGPGLTELLNGKYADFDDVSYRCEDIENLNVIFSGARDEYTPELISSQRTSELLRAVSRKYRNRIVVFDTPPALASAETANLAGYMHQVILVVAWGEANRDQVQRALDNVSTCRNVSLVFNKSPKWHKMNSDYYYYYTEDKNVPQS
jgi:receptor protein-tyrosine kinase